MAESYFPIRRPGLRRRAAGNGHVVVTGDDEIVCELNETGAALFDLCDGETSSAEMVDAICEMFAVDRATVDADVRRALTALVDAGVVNWS